MVRISGWLSRGPRFPGPLPGRFPTPLLVTVRPPKPPGRQRRESAALAGTERPNRANGRGPRPRRRKRERKRWWAVVLPLAAVAGLVAIAPPLPRSGSPTPISSSGGMGGSEARGEAAGPFRYAPDAEAFSLDFDPRQVQFDLLEGWDKEQEAFADSNALAFVSGPMYESYGQEGTASTVPLGDLKLGGRVWRGPNRSASRQRGFLGIRHDGQVDFGYGELTPERADRYDTFIGGLHSIYNDLEQPPAEYKGAYSISMGQQIRYYLPRIRVIYGLRNDGRLAILMSRDGLTLEQTKAMARERGFVAAYMPDHASKSRFIIPEVKGFTSEDANWISGGATSFVHVPYLLRLSRRSLPLSGNLLASLTPHLPQISCGNPIQCGASLASGVAGGLADRVLAGFNRLMEQGVEPLARLIWAPQLQHRNPQRTPQRSPLREPVITADPKPVQERQERDLAIRRAEPRDEPSAPSLPEPQAEPARPEQQAPTSTTPASTDPTQAPTPEPHAGSRDQPSSQGSGPTSPSPAPASQGGSAAPKPASPAAPSRPALTVSAPPPLPAPMAAQPPAAAPRAALPVAPPPPLSPPPPLP